MTHDSRRTPASRGPSLAVLSAILVIVLAGLPSTAFAGFGSPVTLQASGADSPSIAVDQASGAGVVAFVRGAGTSTSEVVLKPRLADGSFPAEEIDLDGGDLPDVAIGPDGTIAVAFLQEITSTSVDTKVAVYPQGRGIGGVVTTLATGDSSSHKPAVVVEAGGKVTVAYVSGGMLRARTRPADGSAFDAEEILWIGGEVGGPNLLARTEPRPPRGGMVLGSSWPLRARRARRASRPTRRSSLGPTTRPTWAQPSSRGSR